ncbi:glycoside hydrolase family 3 protein [Ktedonosporobacter rubrisoli]|nr:glycoside hydrolase family 3 protein [Ktedonosporobacter rubrisoli]
MQSYTDGMSLEEQIGHLLVAGFWGLSPTPEIIDLIQNYHVNNIILFTRNVRDTQQVLDMTQSLQKIARDAGHRSPLLIMIDQENGLVSRLGRGSTVFPGNMALGAIGSEQIAYETALATGRELQALGINMNLAPVVDVNNNPANPVIGVRSFGEDPHYVARLGSAVVKGYREAGVITDLKHFPGHGDTAVDSHLALPSIPYDMARLESMELIPFKAAIEAGADTVMIAHLYLPQIMPEADIPSSVSASIINGLLRTQLGFKGVVISDCLEMHAILDTIGSSRASVLALQAGTDLILVSHTYERQRAAFEAIRSAVKEGELTQEVINQAVERVAQLKARYLSWDNLPAPKIPEWVGGPAHLQLQQHSYELSTTLVRNDSGLIPVKLGPDERLLVLTPQKKELSKVIDRHYVGEAFIEDLQKRHAHVEHLAVQLPLTAEGREEILQAADKADLLLVLTVNANLDPEQAELMKKLLATGKRVIGLAVYNPYDLLAFPELPTCLVTYEYTLPALQSAIRVIFGEQQAHGSLPISLPGLYTRGHHA